MTDRVQENREYVRRLLEEKQPDFAAVLESVEQELCCVGLPRREHRPDRARREPSRREGWRAAAGSRYLQCARVAPLPP
jgi:hypothetical protein